MTDEERRAAEQRARVLIDPQLTGAGWVVQDQSTGLAHEGKAVIRRHSLETDLSRQPPACIELCLTTLNRVVPAG